MSDGSWNQRYERSRDRDREVRALLVSSPESWLFAAALFGVLAGVVFVISLALAREWSLLIPGGGFALIALVAFIIGGVQWKRQDKSSRGRDRSAQLDEIHHRDK